METKSFAQIDIEQSRNYLNLLSAVSKLSGLFSDSSIPYINYRAAENIFCKSFEADNLSRSDTAFDAKINQLGVGLKTFACPTNSSVEKVAEFNSLSRELTSFKEKDLAVKLAEFRNERINLAKRLYGINDSVYHIVARRENTLLLFETDYSEIDINTIHEVKSNKASLQFQDKRNLYSFNYSKSTLFRKFYIPNNAFELPVEIIAEPYDLLLEMSQKYKMAVATDKLAKGVDYVVLPLYGIKEKEKFVFEKSGLNQWNAGGRKRDIGEIYIPVPMEIHRKFPDFFPPRDTHFELTIPTGETFSAKLCQDNSKALMTDPNKAMSDWLLRRVLQLAEGELATIEKLELLGFDSVIVMKNRQGVYKIDIMKSNSYESFLENII